jgi:hypothetical protein
LIIDVLDNLDDATLPASSFDLPVLDHNLDAAQSCQPTHPKDAGTEVSIRCGVVEEQNRFATQSTSVERVLHDKEHIHVIGFWFVRYE